MTKNALYYGDNLQILRDYVGDRSVDLVYLDPPFQSNQDYNILFREQDGKRAAAQIKAFSDTWEWNEVSSAAYHEAVEQGGNVSRMMQAFMTAIGGNDLMAYLSMMAPRLVELRRVLKGSGSIYLHCDPTASHYLKLLMDAVFNPRNFRNEIIWCYRKWAVSQKQFASNHDVILFYTKTAENAFNTQYVPVSPGTMKRWKGQKQQAVFDDEGVRTATSIEGEESKTPMADWWEISIINPAAKERLHYPTQKPEALLERIISASSDVDGLVLDPFCGCGTSVAVAERLNRKWIGIDITHLAIGLIKHRLQTAYGGSAEYEVIGEPVSLPDAAELASDDPYQFQWWAVGMVGARLIEKKKGADQGIDGRLYFHDDPKPGTTKQIILSVKAGHIPPAHVRELRGVIEREGAAIGVLLTLETPTKPMRAEAASAGFYTSLFGTSHPRLQLITIEELLDGKRIDYPRTQANVTYKRAAKYRPEPTEVQADLSQFFESGVAAPEADLTEDEPLIARKPDPTKAFGKLPGKGTIKLTPLSPEQMKKRKRGRPKKAK